MSSATYAPVPYSATQISAWLRGLLTIAWADGQFDPEEQALITQLTQEELAPQTDLGALLPIAPAELAAALGPDPIIRENFLRTAVMMALANGVYSIEESKVINDFLQALALKIDALQALEHTLYDPARHNLEADDAFVDAAIAEELSVQKSRSPKTPDSDVLTPVREWLDGMKMQDPRVARFICKMVPPQCPFERDVVLFGRKLVHIPPMCKLNPLYEQLVGLRFRALSFLADDCREDISPYI